MYEDHVPIPDVGNMCLTGNTTVGPCTTQAQYIGYMYVITPLTIVGTLLNITNIKVFDKYRNKGSTYFYLFSLAIIDMICLLLAVPIGPTRCIPAMEEWEVWVRGVYEAYLYLALGVVFDTMSMWCTVVMSVDRYMQVRQTNSRGNGSLESKPQPKVILAVITLGSAAVNIPYFFIRALDDSGNAVETEFSLTIGFFVYTWIRMGFVKIVPVVIIGVSNVLLIQVVVVVNRKRKSTVFPNCRQVKRQKMQVSTIC